MTRPLQEPLYLPSSVRLSPPSRRPFVNCSVPGVASWTVECCLLELGLAQPCIAQTIDGDDSDFMLFSFPKVCHTLARFCQGVRWQAVHIYPLPAGLSFARECIAEKSGISLSSRHLRRDRVVIAMQRSACACREVRSALQVRCPTLDGLGGESDTLYGRDVGDGFLERRLIGNCYRVRAFCPLATVVAR